MASRTNGEMNHLIRQTHHRSLIHQTIRDESETEKERNQRVHGGNLARRVFQCTLTNGQIDIGMTC